MPVFLLGKIDIHYFKNNYFVTCCERTIYCNHHFNSIHQSLATQTRVPKQVKWTDKISWNYSHLVTYKLVILVNFSTNDENLIFTIHENFFTITVIGKFSASSKNFSANNVRMYYLCLVILQEWYAMLISYSDPTQPILTQSKRKEN